MSKTIEELMIPRRIVIEGWFQSPINPFEVGDILIKNGIHFTRLKYPKSIHQDEIDLYPHLIRPLEWWEDRQPEDMPEYVKWVTDGKTWVIKVKEYVGNIAYTDDHNVGYIYIGKSDFPATEAEYLTSKQSPQ